MLMPLRRYADFSGRSRRKEFWMFVLFMVLVYVGLALLVTVLGLSSDPEGALFGVFGGASLILFGLFVLAMIIPSISVPGRRFHDLDKSGWFYLLNFIPYIGGIIVLVFMCMEGTRGPNRYGPDPKGGTNEEVFA